MINIAIIDDNYREIEPIINILELEVNKIEYSYKYFESPTEEFYNWVKTQINSVVLLDLFFNGKELGENIVNSIKNINNDIPIFIFTSTASLKVQDKYKGMGCYDYIVKNSIKQDDGPILLHRIKQASETGNIFDIAFKKIQNIWGSDQEGAILELNKLLSENNILNLTALSQLQAWIKVYLKKGLEDMAIGIQCLLSILEENSKRIEALKQSDLLVDVMLDKALCYAHLNKNEIEDLLKQIVPVDGAQGKRFINTIMTFCSLSLKKKPNFADIFNVIKIDPSSKTYEDLLEWIYHYNKPLWNEAVLYYLNYWKNIEPTEKRRIFFLFEESSHISEANISTKEHLEIIRFIYKTFLSEVEQIDNNGKTDIELLYHCCKFLFEKIEKEVTLIAEKDSFCKAMNKLSTALFLNNKPADWIKFIDQQIVNIGVNDDKVISEILDRADTNEKVNILYQILENLFKEGGNETVATVLRTNESIISNTESSNYQLYRFGELLKDNQDMETASQFFDKAIKGFFIEIEKPDAGKKRNDILLYIQETIKKLKNMNKNVSKYEIVYQKLSSDNVRVPLPFDNNKCAIAGGHDNIEKNLSILKNSLGGEWTFYGNDISKIKNLANSIKTGGVNVVIYITGFGGHQIDGILIPAMKDKKNVKFFMLPKRITNIAGIVPEVKKRLEQDFNSN